MIGNFVPPISENAFLGLFEMPQRVHWPAIAGGTRRGLNQKATCRYEFAEDRQQLRDENDDLAASLVLFHDAMRFHDVVYLEDAPYLNSQGPGGNLLC